MSTYEVEITVYRGDDDKEVTVTVELEYEPLERESADCPESGDVFTIVRHWPEEIVLEKSEEKDAEDAARAQRKRDMEP